ncbi:DoxX family membrane protein [Streptomyces coeruleoprunus]
MVKVDSDPAQVIVNHASFRVQLGPVQKPRFADPSRVPAMSGAAHGGRRRAPVVWSGKSLPGDPGATGLLQAVRDNAAVDALGRAPADSALGTLDGGTTQVIPRISLTDDTMPTPVVGGQRGPHGSESPLLPPMRRAEGAYDAPEYDDDTDDDLDDDGRSGYAGGPAVHQRHAYYPGRRMNLGVVLLPLRVFLGFISIYAGMGKLCDPVYFDGGERGSMVKWLTSLHPWQMAEPLRDFALSHPVGAGLTVAFAQVVVGVLTVLGLWQRVAAVFGALLSAALLLTVSWRAVPVYDTPDIIYLAAWSPLIIAGAPVYSLDGRLAGEAWRTLGPRAALWSLRRRVLRRGVVVAAVVVGLTLLVGSLLGGAVRSSDMITVPGPNDDPTNHLPGQPLPEEPGTSSPARDASREPSPSESMSSSASATPSAEKSTPSETVRESGRIEEEGPTATQGIGQDDPQQSQPEPPPSTSSGPTSSGGSSSGGDDSGSDDGSGGSSGGNRNPLGGLLG